VQLQRFAELQERRAQIANYYVDRISRDCPSVVPQAGLRRSSHARHLFVIQLPIEKMSRNRDEVVMSFREKNLGVTLHYQPLHHMPLYAQYTPRGGLPVTDRLAPRILTLPIGANMSVQDAADVCDQLVAVVS